MGDTRTPLYTLGLGRSNGPGVSEQVLLAGVISRRSARGSKEESRTGKRGERAGHTNSAQHSARE